VAPADQQLDLDAIIGVADPHLTKQLADHGEPTLSEAGVGGRVEREHLELPRREVRIRFSVSR
jgi:hypothetical protein